MATTPLIDLACVDPFGQTLTFWFADGSYQYAQAQKIAWTPNGYTEELLNVS